MDERLATGDEENQGVIAVIGRLGVALKYKDVLVNEKDRQLEEHNQVINGLTAERDQLVARIHELEDQLPPPEPSEDVSDPEPEVDVIDLVESIEPNPTD